MLALLSLAQLKYIFDHHLLHLESCIIIGLARFPKLDLLDNDTDIVFGRPCFQIPKKFPKLVLP